MVKTRNMLVRTGVLVGMTIGLVACNGDGTGSIPDAPTLSGPNAGAVHSDSINATVKVTCEKRVPPRALRSKISVDGNNLAPGRYRARVTSPVGANAVISRARLATGDEAEFDFDSNTEAGATPINPNYIQLGPGPDVQGEILNESGTVVAIRAVECEVK